MSDRTPLTLGEAMTASPTTIDIDASLSAAKTLMAQLGVNHLPVMDGDLVETIVCDRDIKRHSLPAHQWRDDEAPLVRDISPQRAAVADVEDPLHQVLAVMHRDHIGAVIALRDGELAGIFTETDACGLLAQLLSQHNS